MKCLQVIKSGVQQSWRTSAALMCGAKSVPRLLSSNTPTVRLVTYRTGAKSK